MRGVPMHIAALHDILRNSPHHGHSARPQPLPGTPTRRLPEIMPDGRDDQHNDAGAGCLWCGGFDATEGFERAAQPASP